MARHIGSAPYVPAIVRATIVVSLSWPFRQGYPCRGPAADHADTCAFRDPGKSISGWEKAPASGALRQQPGPLKSNLRASIWLGFPILPNKIVAMWVFVVPIHPFIHPSIHPSPGRRFETFHSLRAHFVTAASVSDQPMDALPLQEHATRDATNDIASRLQPF